MKRSGFWQPRCSPPHLVPNSRLGTLLGRHSSNRIGEIAMHHVRQEDLPLSVVSINLSEFIRATPVCRSSCSTGSPVPGQVRIGILMTKFSSFVKAADCGPSVATLSKAVAPTSLSSRPEKFTVSKQLAIRRWCTRRTSQSTLHPRGFIAVHLPIRPPVLAPLGRKHRAPKPSAGARRSPAAGITGLLDPRRENAPGYRPSQHLEDHGG